MNSPFGLNFTLGRTYNVDLNDTRRAKKAFRRIGYFETPSYGLTDYPDEPLFKAIETFQSDNGLRRDGVMKPEGETATTLGRKLIDSKPLGATKKGDTKPKSEHQETALAAAPAIVIQIANYFGMAVTAALAWWNSMSDDEKDAIRDQVSGNGTETSDDDLDHCESLHYDVDIPTCNNLGKRGDAAAKARCYASAVKRYAASAST